MPKAIKFRNDIFLSSRSILHNKIQLSQFIDTIINTYNFGRVSNIVGVESEFDLNTFCPGIMQSISSSAIINKYTYIQTQDVPYMKNMPSGAVAGGLYSIVGFGRKSITVINSI